MRRIRRGLPSRDPVKLTPLRRKPNTGDKQALVTQFSDELDILQGTLLRVPRSDLGGMIAGLLSERNAKQLLAWDPLCLPEPGLLNELEHHGYQYISSRLPRNPRGRRNQLYKLARARAGITGAAGAIAQIGTLVMPGGKGRSRLASLLPLLHIALVTADQFYPTLDAWLCTQRVTSLFEDSSSLTFIAGPSRTSDIERVVTLGAHGPRELIVVCID